MNGALAWIALFTLWLGSPAAAGHRSGSAGEMNWLTLGTAGGPAVYGGRSQPANLLVTTDGAILVDAGDGAVEQAARAGFVPAEIDTVLLSHLHVDHTAGLLGLMGLRWFTRAPGTLTVYGPPGTDQFVAGLIAALQPAQRIGIGIKGPSWTGSVANSVKVVILGGGEQVIIKGVKVTSAENSHYTTDDGVVAANGSTSLAFRFEREGAAIGYTGDRGPSAALVNLFRGVNLLVSEVIDLHAIEAEILRRDPAMPKPVREALFSHLRNQHLTPSQVGAMARQSGARRLVLTHQTAVGPTAAYAAKLAAEVKRTFGGEALVARDLDHFRVPAHRNGTGGRSARRTTSYL